MRTLYIIFAVFFYKPKTSLNIKFTVYKKGRDDKGKNKKVVLG